ncbi:EthD family reductase [Alicyclobacillus tolerans]|uniref:EthD domain-containing protein n=2 Tax=Alicyclobacillus tolerans TaxID=90970 RepID=A0A1M6KUQ2_9BACL|nr:MULTISPECIES: EthD family reductase [Alicyclobacillus]MDP9727657.1 uncharacterized protein (TIGR02118 family) [Alicyclobacillus tengchongensis]QRF24081.1 EthD family reductase [Alicyclobacillus sp. TC]SHJ62590.1 conserved hypothetical protein [Alicyclobacillus montanus]
MAKLIAIYRQPEDVKAFEDHYQNIHAPLAMKMPGLEKIEVTRIESDAMGQPSEYYLLAEMYFKSQAELQSAMRSPEGKAAAKDLMGFAGKIVQMVIGETVEV